MTANPGIGSLLLRYDPAVVAPDRLIEVLAAQGHVCANGKEGTDPRKGWNDDGSANVVAGWLVNTLAERLAAVVIGTLV